jgi:hypothetical protein
MESISDFLTECGSKRIYEAAIYFGVGMTLMTAFSYVLLGIASLHQGLAKTLIGSSFYILTIVGMLFLLYIMDEGLLLQRDCAIARVDTTSFMIWSAALLGAFVINQLLFGKRLRKNGYYKRIGEP